MKKKIIFSIFLIGSFVQLFAQIYNDSETNKENTGPTQIVNLEIFDASAYKQTGHLWLGVKFNVANPHFVNEVGSQKDELHAAIWFEDDHPIATQTFLSSRAEFYIKIKKLDDYSVDYAGTHSERFSDATYTLSIWITDDGSKDYIKKDFNITISNNQTSLFIHDFGETSENLPPPSPINNTTGPVSVEVNLATGVAFEGVVADEYSSLKLNIDVSSNTSFCNFNIASGQGGIYMQPKSANTGSQELIDRVRLNNGQATIYYHPPRYITNNSLLNHRKAFSSSSGGSIYSMKVPIKFSYTDESGQQQTQIINILVYRPPIMLVHGFTGNKDTWIVLQNELISRKFDAYADNYYRYDDGGYQTIDAQSMLLGELITQRKNEYNKVGIKMQKFDVICHSMGGLFARNYVHKFPSYGNDVRKLIMIATPNHGIEWWNMKRQIFGAIAALGIGQHKALAAEVKSSSPKMRMMNKGEKQGLHLNYNVQYGNIFVATDDLVVSGNSARLNGVNNYPINRKVMHSVVPQFDLSVLTNLGQVWENVAITDFQPAIKRAINWLTHEMSAPNFYNDKIMLTEGKGSIKLGDADSNGNYFTTQVTSFPKEVISYTPVITGADTKRVTLRFSSNGKEWGEMFIAKNTELFFRNFSSNRVDVNIKKGKARFFSSIGKFNITVSPFKDGNEFYSSTREMTFYPRAAIKDLDTDFVVEVTSTDVKVSSIEGRIILENGNDNQTTLINSKEAVKIDNYRNIRKDNFNQSELIQNFEQKVHPLFANVTKGGRIIKAPPGGFSRNSSSQVSGAGCDINKMRPSFYHKIGAVGNTPQAQLIIRMMNDHNKRELYWFNDAKKKFKQGIFPREIKGTFTKKEKPTISNTEYYSQTVTLFKPMKVVDVIEGRYGFSLSRNMKTVIETQNSQEIKGRILQCGSYKIFPKTGSDDRASVRLILEQADGQNITSTNNSSSQTNIPPATSGQGSSRVDQMHPQFQTPIGQVNSQQAQFIARKIDDKNRREQFWFNEDKKKYKQGSRPTEIYGTQVVKEIGGDPNYYCKTVTLFVPTEILDIEWDAKGYRIFKDGKEIKKSWLKKEMIGQVLQPGSYKLYPYLKMGKKKAWIKILLKTTN